MSGKWFLLDIKQAEEKFNTSSAAGLSRMSAGRLLADRERAKKEAKAEEIDFSPVWDITKAIFADPSIAILFGLCVISAFLGRGGTFVFILAFVLPYLASIAVINILITLSQKKVKKILTPFSKVRRDGKLYYVKSKGVVQGDLLYLTSGDYIPVDALITFSDNLRVSYETQNGSILMSKSAENLSKIINDNQPLYARSNILCAGSYVISGTAYAIVTATGEDTYASLSKSSTEKLKEETDTKKDPPKKSLIYHTAFILNLIALGFILIYTLLSLIFPFSGTGMFDAFLAAATLAALTSSGLVTMSNRAVLLSVMLYEECSFARGILINKPDTVEKFKDVRTLFVNDKMFVSDGKLNIVGCYTGGREYLKEKNSLNLPSDYLRNIAVLIFSELVNIETGFARDIRYTIALRNLIQKSGRKDDELTKGCNLIGYVKRGAASKFDTAVFGFDGRTYRVCRAFDESLISASAYTDTPDGIIPLTPDISEKLHTLYKKYINNGCTVITTASVVGSSLVFDGLLAFSTNRLSSDDSARYIKDLSECDIRVIFTSSEAQGDITWYNNSAYSSNNVQNCDSTFNPAEIINNKNIIYLNNISPQNLSDLVKEAGKKGNVAVANSSPFYSEASSKAALSIYCTQIDTDTKIRNDANLPIYNIEEEKQRSAHIMADSDIVLSQPHNKRGGLALIEKTIRYINGKKLDGDVYFNYLINAFLTRLILMLIFAFTGEFISAPLLITAGVLTDALVLAVLVSFDNTGKGSNRSHNNKTTGKNFFIQPIMAAGITSVISFIVSRIFVANDSEGKGFLFTAFISSSAAIFLCFMGRRITISPDSNRLLISLAGSAIILVVLIIMTAISPVALKLGIEISVPGFITAAAIVPVIVLGAQRLSEWLGKIDTRYN